ncbi:MAG: hypothetical protein H6739_17735 [Alphaproteobacteria bacterium]|nr:hypothetical protein [Alphaproteobacteria bacterium]
MELTRLFSCSEGLDSPASLELRGLTTDNAHLRASLVANAGPHVLSLRGASRLTVMNNHLIGGWIAALNIPSSGAAMGFNNLFVGTPGVLSADSAEDALQGWTHNAGWQITDTDNLAGSLNPTTAPFPFDATTLDCHTGAMAALFDAWPDALGSDDLLPAPDSPLVVAGLRYSGSDLPTTGQPPECLPDIGAFGGPYALPAVWAENTSGDSDPDCLEPGRDCDDDSSNYLMVYTDLDEDEHANPQPACLTLYDGDRSPGDDCDDHDPDVHPGAPDDDCDDVDDDCDGVPDQAAVCDTADTGDSDLSEQTLSRESGCHGLWLQTSPHFAALLLAPLLGWGLRRRRRAAPTPVRSDRGRTCSGWG